MFVARTPEEWHRVAVDLSNAGKYARARSALDAAAAGAGDPDLRARITGTRAFVLQRTGEPHEAERLCREALGDESIAARTAAILSGQMGVLALHGGRFLESVGWFTRAIGQLDGDAVAVARNQLNRSVAFMQLRRLDAATADLEAAVDALEANGVTGEAAQARHNLGYVLLLSGDLVGALDAMARARPLAASSPAAEAVVDLDRAEVLRDAGLVREAERVLSHVAGVFGAQRMPQSRAEAELMLSRSLLTHDPVQAGRVAKAAARRFATLGNATWTARADAVRMRAAFTAGGIAVGGRRVPQASRIPDEQAVTAVAADLDEAGLRGDAAALRFAHVIWDARRGGRRTLPRVPAGAPVEVRLAAYEARAIRAVARGREREARRWAADGLDFLSEWQSDFGSLDLQTSVAMHGRALALAGLRSALRSGDPGLAFDWAERARLLAQSVVPLRPPPDQDLADDLAQLRMLRADDPSGAWRASAEAERLRDRARERQWSGTGSGGVQQRVDLDGARAELDERTALIAYVFAGDTLAAVVVRHDGAELVPLPEWTAAARDLPGLRADLDMAAAVRSGPMADVVARSLRDRLASLSRAVLDAPAAAAGAERVVITAPGILNGIPWGMLPAMAGRAFTLAVSATRWTRLHRGGGFAPRAAAFAAGPRVARADEEIEAAASAWAAPVAVTGAAATVERVTALAGGADVLHVAAHGRHAIDNPMFSGLELTDGTLFGYDIDLIPALPQTVVLSACEVGRSAVRWGEEAVGMTRIWLHAGARCVVATPVVVADDDACELLGAMHEGLAAGVSPSEALAAASTRTGIVAPFQVHGAGF